MSVLEAIAPLEEIFGRRLRTEYVEQAWRRDDIAYITNIGRFKADYPEWEITVDLDSILDSLAGVRVGSAASMQ